MLPESSTAVSPTVTVSPVVTVPTWLEEELASLRTLMSLPVTVPVAARETSPKAGVANDTAADRAAAAAIVLIRFSFDFMITFPAASAATYG